MANTIFKTIAGNVNMLPIRAISFLNIPKNVHLFNIESTSQWSLVERLRNHSRNIRTLFGYSFAGEFTIPYNKFQDSTTFKLLESLDSVTNYNKANRENLYTLTSGCVCVISVGSATPPALDEEDDKLEPMLNSTSGFWIYLNYFFMSYEIKTAELRPYITLKITSEIKKRKGTVSPLSYSPISDTNKFFVQPY